MPTLTINGQSHNVDADPDMPLLWALRENVGLTGTKYGCGIAQCGACTIHIDGVAVRSCSTPVAAAMVAKGLSPGAALVFMLTTRASRTCASPSCANR